jgi:predicted alpha-1,2-mannosidase
MWEEHLSRISISDADEDVLKTFYSCLYRAYLYPHRAYELDENGKAVHYSPGKDSVCKGYRYTDNGFWDTYRTVYSLLPLVAPDEYSRILKSFICDYKNDGWLPRWTATDAKCCMPSTMIDPVLADGAKRGIYTNEELEIILEAMLKHANIPSEYDVFGRTGCEDYVRLGYVPSNYHESVNLTLDAAYGDWCIAQIATILGKNDIAEEYYRRAKSYRNLFDAKSGFMRAKDSDGVFRINFSPERWGLDYTEASAYQTSSAVQHDLDGLCELHGGRDAFIKKLDECDNPMVFILWGSNARKKKAYITNKNHLIIESAHPSPLSAYNGFFGSRPFSKANKFLEEHGLEPINWASVLEE